MSDWGQLCNMRSSLLHLQFLFCSLNEKAAEQRKNMDRAHRDRLMQYSSLWQQFISAEAVNFKRLVIMKLQACLGTYGRDEEVWQMMDAFKSYAQSVEYDLMENIGKLYLGKRVMMDIGEVEQQLGRIEERLVGFLGSNEQRIEEYNERVAGIEQARKVFADYLQHVRKFYEEINKQYVPYLTKKLQVRMKEIDESVQSLKAAIYR